MYEPQNFLDLQDANNAAGPDPKSWLSADYSSGPSSPTLRRTLSSLSSAAAAAGNVDQRLFNDLVEMVPLVQSLIESKQKTSFTRRGSMTYTKTPSRDSLYKKTTEARGRNAGQSIPTKKSRDRGDKEQNNGDSFSMRSSRSSLAEKDREELIALREQVEDLQRKLSEKDELLKSAEEISKDQMESIHAELDEMKNKAAEKDSLLKSTQLQLSDAKIKLADKQAAVERLEWEAMSSNKKVEKLQQDLERVEGEISTFMVFADGLKKTNGTSVGEDYDVVPLGWDNSSDIDSLNESEMSILEEAREAYVSAVAAAKEKQDEESIVAAARARSSLQSVVLRRKNSSTSSSCNGGGQDGILRSAEALAH